ncbi:hypothetical protein N0P26_002968 [Acinetobacter baumannii]|uniref:Uncharacterized protein n=5 Tax=Acinetobacter baumannii TaxID=470 RepID=D0CE05_ACIB2|nr:MULTISPECIES: hypothetical protein [Acinetobacter]EXG35419.1 hypothetical protein J717_1649 [Acinetobacter baumannii 121738]AIL75019.1 hypothetical protein IX88_07460 [Acinetobacter baumannii]ARN31623.1 hypothetical protein A4U85_13000 [Acinetobacter baumannii]EEX02316.1 hypothetical protein HMPREF0010_02985 [Acinetobacter baumannii ATCC 19606 = CIP 70.34 = JCM 6841]EKT9122976.1 hypothetical protein [Acinetobacter baumannii]
MKTASCLFIISITVLGLTACASKAEREFVNGCKTGGLEHSTCECIYDKLENKYGEDGFKNNLYTLSQSESFQHDMVQASFQCARE